MGRRSFRQFRTLLVVPHPGTTRPDSLSVRIVFRLNQLPPAPQSGNCFGDISDELSAMLGEYRAHRYAPDETPRGDHHRLYRRHRVWPAFRLRVHAATHKQ